MSASTNKSMSESTFLVLNSTHKVITILLVNKEFLTTLRSAYVDRAHSILKHHKDPKYNAKIRLNPRLV